MRYLVRLLAAVLGLLIAAIGALLVVEVVWAWVRPHAGWLVVPWPIARDRWGQLSWSAPDVRIAAIVLLVVGVLLLVIAAAARQGHIRLHDPAPGVVVLTGPRSLARAVGRQVRAEDGVESASVTASKRRVRVRVRSTSRGQDDAQLRARLAEVAKHAVDQLPMPRKPRVSVSVDVTGSASE